MTRPDPQAIPAKPGKKPGLPASGRPDRAQASRAASKPVAPNAAMARSRDAGGQGSSARPGGVGSSASASASAAGPRPAAPGPAAGRGARPVVDEGNVLGPFVHRRKGRRTPYEVRGLTGQVIRKVFVTAEEKDALDELHAAAVAATAEDPVPTWGELTTLPEYDRETGDARVGLEVELKGMFIDVSKVPVVAAAMAIVGHKAIASNGPLEMHIDAAAGSGQALIEIVTKPLLVSALPAQLEQIKQLISTKATLIAALGEWGANDIADAASVKGVILRHLVDRSTRVDYRRVPVHVQLTTSLTEREFAGPIAKHTQFKGGPAGSGTLIDALRAAPEKTRSTKSGFALVKHAYEQAVASTDIPSDARIDKVPSSDADGNVRRLHTEANKLARFVNRAGERAFLVEYRGGDATTKPFIGDLKACLEGKVDARTAVASVRDALPHLK